MLKQLKYKKTVMLVLLIIVLLFFINSDNNKIKKTGEIQNVIFPNSFSRVKFLDNEIKSEFDASKVSNKLEKKIFDIRLRNKIVKLMNFPLPELKTSDIEVYREYYTDKGKYYEEKFRLITSEVTYAYAYLLVPKNITLPAPTIITMHVHGGTKFGSEEIIGNKGDPTLFYAKELAERGYIVFSMDAATFGQREDLAEDSIEVEEKRDAQDLFTRGYSPLGIVTQEDLISLNFLVSLEKIVDKNNIGCIGHSYGGLRCMYLSALDERIKVTVLSNSVFKFKEDVLSGSTQTWLAILPGITEYADSREILALISPRPLMVLFSEKDPINDPVEVEEILDPLPNLYEEIGNKQDLQLIRLYDKTHEFPLEYHEQTYQFLDKYLKNNSTRS